MTRVTVTGPDGRTFEIDDAVPVADGDAPVVAPVRVVHAAAHVAMLPSYATAPAADVAAHVDWDATRAIRRRLAAHGFGIAEAMDTAQRFEIGWPLAQRLIAECGALRLPHGFVAGAGADQLGDRAATDAERVAAIAEQCAFIRAQGGIPMLLPVPALAARGAGPDEYVALYDAVVERTAGPLLVHWLGPMFLPSLAGYFAGDSFDRVMDLDPTRIRGCKLSLLDAALELRVRRRLLPRDQVVLTGDDFHFGALIRGGDPGDLAGGAPAVERWSELGGRPLPLGDFSHALLGVFDGIAAPAGRALRLLAVGRDAEFTAIMARCEALGRHVFAAPTAHYKAGLALIAWLNGWQPELSLPFGAERTRDLAHHWRTAELAAAAGALTDAACAAERLARLAAVLRGG